MDDAASFPARSLTAPVRVTVTSFPTASVVPSVRATAEAAAPEQEAADTAAGEPATVAVKSDAATVTQSRGSLKRAAADFVWRVAVIPSNEGATVSMVTPTVVDATV